MKRKIQFFRVDCSGNESRYLQEVIKSGWLTTGGKCLELEKRIAAIVGAKYACGVNSATAALHLTVEALGFGPGDKIFVPTMTFAASAGAVRFVGADPVFLDVEYGTCLVTPAILKAAITEYPDVKALVLVHFGGQAAEMGGGSAGNETVLREGILDLCRKHGLKLIEDAAHAFPTRSGGRMIGSFGDATCFSFYANKPITTGEGGMLLTQDEALYRRAKIMRLHGIDRDVWDRFTAERAAWEYDVVAPGYKYNLSDAAAAIGLAQLERAEEFRRDRQRCAEFYYRELAGVTGIDLPVCHGAWEDHSWHLFWIVLNEESRISRNAFIEKINASGIGTSVHYKPLHRMTYYRERYCLGPDAFPSAERHWQGAVSLPIYPSLTDDELAYICRQIRQALNVEGGRD